MFKRTIQKNYMSHITSSCNRSQNSKFVLKSQGENWIQYHSEAKLQDIVSLPSQLRMSKLDLSVDGSFTKSGKSQHIFSGWNHDLYIGYGDFNDMTLQVRKFNTNNSFLNTNYVCIGDGQYCNMSLNNDGTSTLNIVQGNKNISNIQLSYPISHSTNISYKKSSNNILYISNNNSNTSRTNGTTNSQHIVSYDVEYNEVNSTMQLPETQIEGVCKVLPLTNYSFQFDNNLICAYCRDWLTLWDVRMSAMVLIDSLYDCESIFTYPYPNINNNMGSNMYKLLLTQGNQIFCYELQKSMRDRKAILNHNKAITNANLLNSNTICVQDVYSSGIHLYCLN